MLALVYYLVMTIVALRSITKALDEVITGVVEIIEKTAPVNDVVRDINEQLDAGVELLEGLLVKKAGIVDAVGLVDGLYRGRRRRRLPLDPREPGHRGAAHRRGLHAGHADARAARPRGADRHGQPERAGAAQRRGGSLSAQSLYPEFARRTPRSCRARP